MNINSKNLGCNTHRTICKETNCKWDRLLRGQIVMGRNVIGTNCKWDEL